MWLDDQPKIGLRGPAFYRPVPSTHFKPIPSRREIVIIGRAAVGGGDPLRVIPRKLVLERDSFGSAQRARRELDLYAVAPRADDYIALCRRGLIVHQYRLDADGRMV